MHGLPLLAFDADVNFAHHSSTRSVILVPGLLTGRDNLAPRDFRMGRRDPVPQMICGFRSKKQRDPMRSVSRQPAQLCQLYLR